MRISHRLEGGAGRCDGHCPIDRVIRQAEFSKTFLAPAFWCSLRVGGHRPRVLNFRNECDI